MQFVQSFKNLAASLAVLFALSSGVAFAEENGCNELLSDHLDMRRDWGVRLLDQDNAAFSNPEYLQLLQSLVRPGAVGMDPRWRGLYDKVLHKFESPLLYTQSARVKRFTNSGTDANNALFEYAEKAFEKRTGQKAKRAHLLYFSNPYAGVHGRSAEFSIRYEKNLEYSEKFEIPTPHLKSFQPKNGKELLAVQKIEDEAVAFIRKQVANLDLEVGGIFVEPINATKGIFMYRPEFMKRLRELADELNVPIFADEILTGGGRTGKFWAYEHYPEFEPDLITFGKGMGIAGIAEITRYDLAKQTIRNNGERWRFFDGVYDNTSVANALALAQAGQVLNTIYESKLVKNAEESGAYFLDQIKAKARKNGMSTDNIRGVGMLIYLGDEFGKTKSRAPIFSKPIQDYLGRLTPAITLTPAQIDQMLED